MAWARAAGRNGLIWLANGAIVLGLPLIWGGRQVLRLFLRRRRISLWTGAPILTIPKNCRAERSLGFDSYSVVTTAYYITDEFDVVLSRLAKGNPLLLFALRYVAFIGGCVAAEQIHGYADGAFLPSLNGRSFSRIELFAYRLLGIRLIVWTYGADVRTRNATRALGDPNCCTDCRQIGKACVCDDKLGQENYRYLSKRATAVFSMGDMIEYTPGARNDVFFWPIDLQAEAGLRYRPVFSESGTDKPLRVVHAPNHHQFKGTDYLQYAVESLRLEGVSIELVLVEKVSNAKALDLYRSADVIFDQCLIGFHGYFALEAMALGKAVMCFIRKPDLYLLHPEECPIINTHVETLQDDLRQLISRRAELAEIGRRGRQYVEKYFSSEAFSRRLQQAYHDLGIVA